MLLLYIFMRCISKTYNCVYLRLYNYYYLYKLGNIFLNKVVIKLNIKKIYKLCN